MVVAHMDYFNLLAQSHGTAVHSKKKPHWKKNTANVVRPGRYVCISVIEVFNLYAVENLCSRYFIIALPDWSRGCASPFDSTFDSVSSNKKPQWKKSANVVKGTILRQNQYFVA